MRKIFASAPLLLFLTLLLSGCQASGGKAASQSIVYTVAVLLAFTLLIGLCLLVRQKKGWFLLLFSSVVVVNVGYAVLAVSTSLEMALWANRIAYFGSVFLPLSMLMIILNVSGTKHPKWIHHVLAVLSILIFLVAASPGVLPLYYKEVTFEMVGGVSKLVKVYGPLHPLYMVYLLGYFTAMVTVIIRAKVKKTIENTAHAVILLIAVFVNLFVWLIEQISDFDFEMLSISYIISELFLLGVHLVMRENQRLREIVRQVETAQGYTKEESADLLGIPMEQEAIEPERIDLFMQGLNTLTPTERAICDAYIARATTGEIMAKMNIKETTLKYHNRNIYGKLGVANRKELLELHKQVKTVKTALDQIGC